LAKSIASIENMSRANYFCITSYPQYNGFRVEHDPVITAYIAEAPLAANVGGAFGFVVAVIVIAAVALVVVALLLKRRKAP